MKKLIFGFCIAAVLVGCASKKSTGFHAFAHPPSEDKLNVLWKDVVKTESGQLLLSGRVVGRPSGQALPGASVLLAKDEDSNSTEGLDKMQNSGLTATDVDGYFEIYSNELAPDAVIVISFIGYHSLQYSINDVVRRFGKSAH